MPVVPLRLEWAKYHQVGAAKKLLLPRKHQRSLLDQKHPAGLLVLLQKLLLLLLFRRPSGRRRQPHKHKPHKHKTRLRLQGRKGRLVVMLLELRPTVIAPRVSPLVPPRLLGGWRGQADLPNLTCLHQQQQEHRRQRGHAQQTGREEARLRGGRLALQLVQPPMPQYPAAAQRLLTRRRRRARMDRVPVRVVRPERRQAGKREMPSRMPLPLRGWVSLKVIAKACIVLRMDLWGRVPSAGR